MKTIITASLFLLIPLVSFSQSNFIKGGAIGWPFILKGYAVNLGYERSINPKWSAQLIHSRRGYNFDALRGNQSKINAWLPELRYYVNINSDSAALVSSFLGLYGEYSVRTFSRNGEYYDENGLDYFKRQRIATGVLYGQKIQRKPHRFIELYIGAQVNFDKLNSRYVGPNIDKPGTTYPTTVAIRFGLNVGFCF